MNTARRTTKLAVAYCRVSTDHEEQKKSISEQKAQWLEKFKENGSKNAQVGLWCHREIKQVDSYGRIVKGKIVTEPRTDGLYIDEGISGKSKNNRRAFLQMIEDAKQRKFDMIYVEDVSRFSRSIEDGYVVIKDLRDIGIGVHFRKEGWNSLDPSKDFELSLRLSIAQEENRSKSDRIKWALDRLRKNGGWSSTPPYGYDKINGYLQINPYEAEVVKQIYNLFTEEHWGATKIAKHLNRINAPTKRGGYWRDKQVRSILRNEIYTGKQVSHKKETRDITRNTSVDVDPNDWVIFEKEELRIISDELFDLTQIENKRHSELVKKGSRPSCEYLLSGLLYCNHCGSCFTRKRNNNHRKKDGSLPDCGYVWVCHTYDTYGGINRLGGLCKGERVQVKEEDCIKAIQYEIQGLKDTDMEAFFQLYLEYKFKDIKAHDRDTLKKEEESLLLQMRQLRQDKVDGLLDEELYKEDVKRLNDRISEIRSAIARIDRLNEDIQHARQLFDEYKQNVKAVDIDNLTNSVLKGMFHKIFVSYRKDSNGKKIPYLRFVYRFLDTTDDDIFIALNGEKDGNILVFNSLYMYKHEESKTVQNDINQLFE